MGEILNLDHVGIAVKDLHQSIQLYESLGLQATHRETVAAQKVNTVTLPIGDTKIELLEPTTEESAIAKFLRSRGEGVHHLAIQVDNLEEKLSELKILGIRLIDETPRIGIGGTRVAFIHPQSTLGTLIELVERKTKGE
ncbi:MAG: methylmalonyl-CoA epimerase [Desulfitobacteriaceae bacterium]